MPHPGPGKLRTPRKRALEIGTDSGKFVPELPYCPQGGHPITPDMPSDMHETESPAVGGSGQPIQSNPIK